MGYNPRPGYRVAGKLRKKEAEFKKERAINKYIVGNVVIEMAEKIIPISISNNIIDILVDRSVSLGRTEVIWKEMVDAEFPIVSSSSSTLEEPPVNQFLLCLNVRRLEEPKGTIGNSEPCVWYVFNSRHLKVQ